METGATGNVEAAAAAFDLRGRYVSAAPYGSGHINDTYDVICEAAGGVQVHYILQRLNHLIFKNPPALQHNIERVTAHIRKKLCARGVGDIDRRVLTLIPTHIGESYHHDADGNYWRCYIFITEAQTYDQIETPQQAYEAAKAFGLFQKELADLPTPRLVETIPGFHDTRQRFDVLQQAIDADTHNRAADVRDEIAYALASEDMVDVLLDLQREGVIPERITHNDTKLNNVMLDDGTGEGICVIDLDTVMPGLALYDFGDMIRTATRPTLEDEVDTSKVVVQVNMFEALAKGYLAAVGDTLTAAEKAHLVFSGKLISFEIGIRFLADYLQGDVYFKTHRARQNVDRCRVQFKMVQSIAEHEAELTGIVEACTPNP